MNQQPENHNGKNSPPATDHIAKHKASPDQGQSLEENLEKLAALNLSSDKSMQPRLSNAMIRLVSAAAGIGALILLYYIFKLFL